MLRALLLMFAAQMLIPSADSAAKLMAQDYGTHPIYAAWTRFAIAALCIAPFAPRGSLALLKDWRIIFRGLLITGGIACILTALRTEEVANVFAAFFIGPIVSYTLSVFLLGERVTLIQTLLLLLGFAGVLIVVQPGANFSPGLGWAVLAGCFHGTFLTTSKWLVGLGNARALLFTQLIVGAVALAPFGLMHAPALSAPVIGLTLASSWGSMFGNLLLLMAYATTDSTRLAPMIYFQLISATALGFFIFDTFPDTTTLIGLTLVIVSGVSAAVLRQKPILPAPVSRLN
ncbi:DMT family transporter [Nereida sp. MMG025]|uniref:DMT family transporter n=1 Tax=Nereida sp. MMG025 TaxID=2909981 RepID=UPI001F362D85|nr:DMT family transporter [Nereida sp. MMG025]MCF6445569.1 DMT family transporter [Nereida sp. MMG025]